MKMHTRSIKRFLLFAACILFLFSTCSSFAAVQSPVKSLTVLKEMQNLLNPSNFSPPSDNQIKNIKVIGDMKFKMPDILLTSQQTDAEKEASGTRNGTVFVLVNAGVYKDIKANIMIYTTDLAKEGYSTRVYTVSGKDPIQLKSFIRSCWIDTFYEYVGGELSLEAMVNGTGVFIVGDLPVPLVHSRVGEYVDENGAKKPYEGTFVCDLYLTDMDGNWDYTDDNGVPFISTVDPGIIAPDSECTKYDFAAAKWKPFYKGGKGGAKPEIWMGRLPTTQLATVNGVYNRDTEIKLLKEYFERNHAYRHGNYPYVPSGESGVKYAAIERLLYFDDPWASAAPKIMNFYKMAWPGPVVHDYQYYQGPVNRYVNTESITSHIDYMNRLPKYTLWLEMLAHSNPWYHEFVKWAYNSTKKEYEWQDVGWISTDNLTNWPMHALFYNIQGCDACDYRQERFLGGRYLLTGNALAVIGNTTVGPHDSGTLYYSLAKGANIGQAFMLNQKAFGTENWLTDMVTSYDGFDAKRYYGQTLLGDPTLKPIPVVPRPEPVNIGHTSINCATLTPILGKVLSQSELNGVGNIVKSKIISEARGKLKAISVIPSKGFEYLKPDPNKIIQDPQFKLFVNLSDLTAKTSYSLTIQPVSASVATGGTVLFSGQLTVKPRISLPNTAGSPVPNKSIDIYEIVKRDNVVVSATLAGKGSTDAAGKYQIRITPADGKHIYVAIYRGPEGDELASSEEAAITAGKLRIIPRITTR